MGEKRPRRGEWGKNNGKLVIQDNAQLNASSMRVATWGGGTHGAVEQNGGTVNLNLTDYANWWLPALQLGLFGDSQGEYHLNGGILITGSIGGNGNADGQSSKFYFNGGTLQANGGDGDAASIKNAWPAMTQDLFMQNLTQVVVQAGGAKINTNGHSITIAPNLEHDPAGGAPAIDGGLTKQGAGTLILTGANTYTGKTRIEGGMLSISNPYLNDLASVYISNGAELDLNFISSDTIGSLYLDGALAPTGTWGAPGSGAAHIDDIHFSGTGQLNIVPEPSTLVLLGVGAIGLLAWAWRRRKRAG